jgi:enamine deaminase RidA (YjgF/YER057c/UK114 family)
LPLSGRRVDLQVISGYSDLLVERLGEAGRHAHSVIGVGSLPNRMTVEIEAILLKQVGSSAI